MIIDEIKKENIQAMKDHNANARAIYSVLMNKHLMLNVEKKAKGESVTDAEMIGIIQKTIKELEEEKQTYASANREEEVKNLQEQLSLLDKFLPEMMSAEEIEKEILTLTDKSIPAVMKHFKANFQGKCEMKLVQEVLKKLS